MADVTNITGLILAGGAGRRAGGRDKGLITWCGRPLVAHVAERLRPQVGSLLISCNRNGERYGAIAPTVATDLRSGYQGPLAGLEAASANLATDKLVIVPCDTPELPGDLVSRLIAVLEKGEAVIAYAHDGERCHYLCAALCSHCLSDLPGWLDRGGRAVRHWYRCHRCLAVDFSDQAPAFRNINNPG
jgi:molybdopterin-guanine dinucleotide biosynthesis protein A